MGESDPKDAPLTIAVEDGQLTMRIGINILAFAAEHCPLLATQDQIETIDPPYVSVVDKEQLAEDVVRSLTHEEEDGSTPVHGLLDKAILEAYEQGSLGFEP